jgi:hypothetical protein
MLCPRPSSLPSLEIKAAPICTDGVLATESLVCLMTYRGMLTGTPPSLKPILASSTAIANASWSFIVQLPICRMGGSRKGSICLLSYYPTPRKKVHQQFFGIHMTSSLPSLAALLPLQPLHTRLAHAKVVSSPRCLISIDKKCHLCGDWPGHPVCPA